MFQAEVYGGRVIGHSYLYKHVLFFFGTREADERTIQAAFPEYEFAFAKQVHGRKVVEADPGARPEADGLFTRRATRALVVQTADCAPVLLVARDQVCALHSGWRGTEQNIIDASRTVFAGQTVLAAALGPHLQRTSFEVGRDVATRLLASAPTQEKADSYVYPHTHADKAWFDLTELLRDQVHASYGPHLPLFELTTDTKTNSTYHSFRRDGANAGRQLSFVVINS